MADPYSWDYTVEDDLTNSDIFSDVGFLEDKAIKLAIQNSLETFQQEGEGTNDMDRPTDLQRQTFTAEEIKEDECRRDRELYGPPTPRRNSQEITAMNNSGLIPLDTVLAGLKKPESDKAFLKKPVNMVVSEIVDAMVEYNKARPIPRPVVDWTFTSASSFTGYGLDTMETPCHAVRVAIIKAALSDPNSPLGALVRAHQTQNITRRASPGPVSRAATGQGTPASDEEQQRSAGEQSPRKRARHH